jgi:hypothetical protein
VLSPLQEPILAEFPMFLFHLEGKKIFGTYEPKI